MKNLFGFSPNHSSAKAWQQRLRWAAGGLCGGVALAALSWADALLDLWTLRQQAQEAQETLALQQAAVAGFVSVPVGPAGPAWQDADSLWPWLQERLQTHGLQVRSLQPQAMGAAAAGQVNAHTTVHLQLQGRWQDWQSFVMQMNAHVPWWQLLGWQVVPAGEVSELVRLQVQLRLGWHTPLPGKSVPIALPRWPVPQASAGVALFGIPVPGGRDPGAMVGAAAAVASATPAQLRGVWLQAGQGHAVFREGERLDIRRAGQPLAFADYRLVQVSVDGVQLQDRTGQRVALTLGKGGKK